MEIKPSQTLTKTDLMALLVKKINAMQISIIEKKKEEVEFYCKEITELEKLIRADNKI